MDRGTIDGAAPQFDFTSLSGSRPGGNDVGCAQSANYGESKLTTASKSYGDSSASDSEYQHALEVISTSAVTLLPSLK